MSPGRPCARDSRDPSRWGVREPRGNSTMTEPTTAGSGGSPDRTHARTLTPELDPNRWEALVARIVADARPLLEARRRRHSLARTLSGWRRPVMTGALGLAAAATATLLLLPGDGLARLMRRSTRWWSPGPSWPGWTGATRRPSRNWSWPWRSTRHERQSVGSHRSRRRLLRRRRHNPGRAPPGGARKRAVCADRPPTLPPPSRTCAQASAPATSGTRAASSTNPAATWTWPACGSPTAWRGR